MPPLLLQQMLLFLLLLTAASSATLLDLTQLLGRGADLVRVNDTAGAAAAAESLRSFVSVEATDAASAVPVIWPAAPVSASVEAVLSRWNGGLGLSAVAAVAVRPDSPAGTLLAVRGPWGGPLLLNLRYRLIRPGGGDGGLSRLQLEVRLGRTVRRFEHYRPDFRLGQSWLVFHAAVGAGAIRFQFWCPGGKFWSDSGTEYRLPLPTQSLLEAVQIPSGSTLHLMHDGIGDHFQGYVHRLALLSPAASYAERLSLKCDAQLRPAKSRRVRSAEPPRPPPQSLTASGEDEPPPPPTSSTTPPTTATATTPTTWMDASGDSEPDEEDATPPPPAPPAPTSDEEDATPLSPPTPPPTPTSNEIVSNGASSSSNMELAPTLRPSCQLIAGKTVCNYHGSLLLTQLLINLTTTPLPAGRRQSSIKSTERHDSDAHVDLVDDLSDFFGGKSRSGGGRSGPLPPGFPRATPTGPSSGQHLTTTPSNRMYVTPLVFRGEKGDTGPSGPPGVCPQSCRLPVSELQVLPSTASPGLGVDPRGNQSPPGGQRIKGERGTPGPAGVQGSQGPPGECRPDQCGRGAPPGPRGADGAKGALGPAGEKGEPGGADANSVRELVRSEVQVLSRGPKGDKGDRGGCDACGGERSAPSESSGRTAGGSGGQAYASTSVRVLRTYQAFADVGYVFEEGTLVFTKDEKILYLKIDYRLNQWIEVANYIVKPKIQLGFPSTTASPRMGSSGAQIFLPYMVTGKKIRLVALPMKLHGDLYYKSASSILGADYACHDAAMAAGLSRGYFKVFLNGQFNNLDTIVHSSQRAGVPIVNLHGQKLFSSFSDMMQRGAWNKEVQLQDFGGRNLSEWREHYGLSEILAWQGLRQSQRQANMFSQDCEGFTNRDPAKLGYVTDLAGGQLFQSREITCDTQQVVLCIEAFDENTVITNPMDYRRRR